MIASTMGQFALDVDIKELLGALIEKIVDSNAVNVSKEQGEQLYSTVWREISTLIKVKEFNNYVHYGLVESR